MLSMRELYPAAARATIPVVISRLRVVAAIVALSSGLAAQERPAPPASPKPWFGLALPPRAGGAPAVRVGSRDPRPVTLPPGEVPSPDFNGAAIKADVATIVGFAHQSRVEREVGAGQMWGRISGFSSSDRTVAWAADQFRKAGISEVVTQPIAQDPKSELWLPRSWQVRLLADPAFGPGSSDIVLESALPVSPSAIPSGTMTAPLVTLARQPRRCCSTSTSRARLPCS